MTCPVCLDAAADVVTRCGHSFCAPCLSKWRQVNSTCPVCRGRLHEINDFRFSLVVRVPSCFRKTRLRIEKDRLYLGRKRYHVKRIASAYANNDVVTLCIFDGGNIEEVTFRTRSASQVLGMIGYWFAMSLAEG